MNADENAQLEKHTKLEMEVAGGRQRRGPVRNPPSFSAASRAWRDKVS